MPGAVRPPWRTRPELAPDEARELHAQALVIDTAFHGDFSVPSPRLAALRTELVESGATRIALWYRMHTEALQELRHVPAAQDAYLDLWRRSGVSVGLATTVSWEPDAETAFESCVRGTAELHELVDVCAGDVVLARSASDLETAHAAGVPALVQMWQNSTPIGHDLDRVAMFHGLGVRTVQLTYNLRNLAGDGCTERNAGGLSHFGVSLVERLNEMRIAVDVSHSSEAVGWDALACSTAPISITHATATSVFAHARAKSDDLLRAVAARGGYIGIALVPAFLGGGSEATLDDLAAHIEHVARVAGIDAVGIGADMGSIHDMTAEEASGGGFYPPGFPWHGFRAEHRTATARRLVGFRTVEDWPNLTVHLASRGFNEDELRKILGQNYLRYFREVVG